VHRVGQGLAQAKGSTPKHAIKQVDRLLSNNGIVVWSLFAMWIPFLIGSRMSIIVAMDWTDFDDDGHSTIMLSLLTKHGRATPLIWLTVDKKKLKNRRNEYEDRVLIRLFDLLPPGVDVTIPPCVRIDVVSPVEV
jgi:hypothetical protein